MVNINVIVAFKKVKPESGIIPKAIGWYTNSKYYHVEIAIDNYWVSVFPENGVVLNPIGPLDGNWDYKKIKNVKLTEEQYNKITDFLLKQENKKYDHIGILLAQFIKFRIEVKNHWFCSELVGKMLQLLLVDKFLDVDTATLSPENIFKLLEGHEMLKEIPRQYVKLLDHIESAEGGVLHRNKNESDITSSWGIYRGSPDGKNFTELWDYIENVGKNVTDKPTHLWDSETIKAVDEIIKQDPITEHYLSYKFYKKYLRGARLKLFPDELVIVMANLYTNTPLGAWMSVQEALIDITKDKILDLELDDLSAVDGGFGKKTRDSLIKFRDNSDWKDVLIFKKSILLAMKTYYIDLSTSDVEKYLRNLPGWNARVENLEHIQG